MLTEKSRTLKEKSLKFMLTRYITRYCVPKARYSEAIFLFLRLYMVAGIAYISP